MADFYAVLSVPRDASDDDIKQSYRKLAMQWHPDRNGGSKDAEEKFKTLTEAYDVLRDPQKRAAYDRYGEAGLRGASQQQYEHVDLAEALNIFMRDFGGAGLGDLFGQGGGRGRGGGGGSARAGADVKITLPMTLAEVATGIERSVVAKLLEACDKCEGSGAEPGTKPTTCPTCQGSGEVRRAQRSFFGQFVSVAPCPTCAGEGIVVSSPCKKCRGEGRMRGEKTLKINVPAGVATGQYMTLRGAGNAGPRGGPRGDVLVIFEVEDDERFERDAEDLFCEALVTYPQLVFGSDIKVAGVTSEISLRVPAGTQSGTVFHLRGRGLPRVNASGTGDLHVRVQLWTPQTLSNEEEHAVKVLSGMQSAAPKRREKSIWSKMKEALGA
ncbi:MAG: molecular chaperone DnaJ [Gemmatimonadaceae bacterium]